MVSATFIGFGEAAMAFAAGMADATAYDRKTAVAAAAPAKLADYARLGVRGAASNAEAVAGAPLLLSLVTADQALAAASDTAAAIVPHALFLDMNSVAPATKRSARDAIEAASARYVDVAVMAPVDPARRAVPLLLSGSHAEAGAEALRALGFADVRIVGRQVGDASAIKMIRSVMVKGLEALTAECMLAAEAAGVRGEVTASLDASWPGADWAMRADYNLDRMMMHGLRRAAEMEEVAATLDTLGTGSLMTRATVARQRAIGARALSAPAGLAAKLGLLLDGRAEAA